MGCAPISGIWGESRLASFVCRYSLQYMPMFSSWRSIKGSQEHEADAAVRQCLFRAQTGLDITALQLTGAIDKEPYILEHEPISSLSNGSVRVWQCLWLNRAHGIT